MTVDDRGPAYGLKDALLPVRAAVTRLVEGFKPTVEGSANGGPVEDFDPPRPPIDGIPTLYRVVSRFGLDPFETDLLMLCAGMEVDPHLVDLLSESSALLPTAELAMAALPGSHWRALAAGSPLRRWQLIEIGPGETLLSSPLRISERLLMQLVGVDQLDERLAGIVHATPAGSDLDPAYAAETEVIRVAWDGDRHLPGAVTSPVVRLVGGDPDEHAAIVGWACAKLGLTLFTLPQSALPAQARELEALSRLWEREAMLGDSALLVLVDEITADRERDGVLGRFLAGTAGCIAVSGDLVPTVLGRDVLTIAVAEPSAAQRRTAWESGLAEAGLRSGSPEHFAAVEEFLRRSRMAPLEIRGACRQAALLVAASKAAGLGDADVAAAVNDAYVRRARPRLDGLAQRVETAAAWDDLILPQPQTEALRGIVRNVAHRDRVHDQWGFSGFRGNAGVTALFAGPSGTGKTMAAGVIARELGLELYRVDLGGLVDKYIGETEKNLSRVFAAAQRSGAVLFFDEADALFGRRSEVRDSHDRYANIQVSHLLQRMDSYDGLAILATNMSTAMDNAFLRRLSYVVRFPFPDLEQRRQMWRGAFPVQTPTTGLDEEKLAGLQVSGGSIRNIALAAAFRAAADDVPVGMAQLLAAAIEECAKQDRAVLPAEVQGWV